MGVLADNILPWPPPVLWSLSLLPDHPTVWTALPLSSLSSTLYSNLWNHEPEFICPYNSFSLVFLHINQKLNIARPHPYWAGSIELLPVMCFIIAILMSWLCGQGRWMWSPWAATDQIIPLIWKCSLGKLTPGLSGELVLAVKLFREKRSDY